MEGAGPTRFGILGPLVVEVGGVSRVPSAPRQRALLALLLLAPEGPTSAEQILERLWGDELPSGGVKTVGFHLSKLRDALEPDRPRGSEGSLIRTTPAGYVLDVDPDAVDAVRFERLLEQARGVLSSDPGRAAALARDALGLWRGRVLAEFAYEEFAQEAIRRLGELRLRAVETRIEADLALGRHGDVVGELERLVDEYPFREGLRASLMVALYRSGRQADALRAFEAGRRVLADELGIEPSRELRDLEQRILEQDPSLDLPPWAAPSPAAPRTAPVRNPYKGLRSFGEDDAGDFFGRTAVVGEITARLGDPDAGSLAVLVGPSGCGKSSVVAAGLLPALRSGALPGSEAWMYVRIYPGAHPVEELEVALLKTQPDTPGTITELLRSDTTGLRRAVRLLVPDDAVLLLVVDQLEELWSLADTDERRFFLDLLAGGLEDPRCPLRVVATLRSDFLGDALEHPALAGLLRRSTILVPPMDATDLEAAVVEPARRVGIPVDPALVGSVIADIEENPGALPLLQYALTEAFEHRRGDTLDHHDYETVGGLRSALARRADQTLAALPSADQAAARQVFLRLISPGDGTADTRRRVTIGELHTLGIPHGDIEAVLTAFGDARLLTFDREPAAGTPTVEVAHEALITEWPPFAGWIDDARSDLITHRRLTTDASQWEESGRDPDYLPTGSRLDHYEDWAAGTTLTLTAGERDYLDASIAKERHEQATRVRRRRMLTGILAGAALVAGVLALMAVLQWRRADESAALAEEQAGIAEQAAEAQARLAAEARARELATAATSLDGQHELAMLLALEAVAVEVDGEPVGVAVDALHRAVISSPVRGRFPADVVAADRSGRFLVTGFVDRLDLTYPALWDRATGEQRSLPVPDSWVGLGETGDGVTSVALAPDGSLVAAGLAGGAVVVFDTATLDEVWTTNDRQAVWTDTGAGSVVLTFGDAATDPFSSDASAGEVERALESLDLIHDAAVSGAGTQEEPWIVELTDHVAPFTYTLGIDPAGSVEGRGHRGDHVRHLAFHPDGTRLASAALDGTRLWDLTSDAELRLPGVPRAGLAFSVDGSMLAGGWPDTLGAGRGQATAVVWDVESGEELHRLPSVGRDVTGVAFGPYGDYLAVSYADGDTGLGIWDLTEGIETEVFDTAWNGSVAVDPAGSRIAAGGDLFEVEGSRIRLLRQLTTTVVLDLAFGDSGVLVGNLDTGDALVWDLTAGGESEWLTVPSGTNAPNGVAVGHGGRMLAAGEGDEYRIIDAATGYDLIVVEPGPDLVAHHGLEPGGADYRVVDAEFSPDDGLLATAIDDSAGGGGAVMVWDTADGDLVAVLGDPGHARGGWCVSFSPDGSLLAASVNNAIVMWDTVTFDEILTVPPSAALWWTSVAFSPDGARIAARAEGFDDSLASFGNHVAVFDLEGNQVVRCCEHDPARAGASVIVFSPNGMMLLTNGGLSGGAYDVGLWDAETGDRVGALGPLDGLVTSVAFSPDGDRVAVGDGSRVRIFDTETGTLLSTLPALYDDSLVTDLAFGPDGTTLAVALQGECVTRVFALDVYDLVGIAAERLTRSFTDAECRIYAVDPCPTLEEIRASAG